MYVITLQQQQALKAIQQTIYDQNVDAGWHNITDNCQPNDIHVLATKIALIHSEISEALEGLRKNLNDDHLPERKAIEVELADAMIRIFDLGGALELDLAGAIAEKFIYNQKRSDHKMQNRLQENGKKF